MRKILIIVLIVILIILGYFTIISGLNIFGLNISSIKQIKEKSDILNSKLEQVSTLTSIDYPAAISTLNESSKQLILEKNNYAELVSYSSSEEVTAASQVEKYEMEYLWTKIGNHATKKGIVLKIDIRTSASGTPNVYDIYFTATGKYISISEFIASLEDDSSLAFKIEEFKLLPTINKDTVTEVANTTTLEATFTVKDIAINIDLGYQNSTNTNNLGSTSDSTNTKNNSNNTVNTNNTSNKDQASSVVNDIQNSISNDINYSKKH